MYNSGSFPGRITIELTNRCNLACSFCPRHLVDVNLGNMEPDLFRKVVDEAANYLPVCLVLFFRGESLLHPQLPEMINYAKSKGLGPVQLASNGVALTEELSERLLDSGLDFISFSLDTLDSDIYSNTRKNGDLQKTIINVINFVNRCEERRKKGLFSPEIQVSTVDVPDYRAGQKKFIDFWRSYADKVRVYIEHSSDGNLGSIQKNLPFERDIRNPCKKVFTDIVIYWDGKIALCNHDWDNKIELGNVGEQSIFEIWNSPAYQGIRKMHNENDFSAGITCLNCDHWQMYYLPEGYLGRVYSKVGEDSFNG